MSVNKAILIGYVGTDPEMRFPGPGQAYARLRLATNERMAGGVEVTDWHTLIFSGEPARIIERYVRKGSRLYVEGKIKYREYEDRMHIVRRVTEIIVTDFDILGRLPSPSDNEADKRSTPQ